jgi:hypothetical protein
MNVYRAGAISDGIYAPRDATGAIIALPGIAFAAPTGMTVTLGSFTAGVGHAFTVKPDATAAGTTGEIVVTGTNWRDVITYTVLPEPAASTTYGSLSGVAGMVGALATAGFSTTTTPSAENVTLQLAVESADVDGQLSAVGYVVPVTDATALVTLDSIVNRLVAAYVFETLAAGKNPSMMALASNWRGLAQVQLQRAIVGRIAFTGVPGSATHAQAVVPTVTTQQPMVADGVIENFMSAWGGRVGQ